MFRERPLTGFGPGMFGAEYVPHRLAAEIRYGRRFVNPLVTSSYGEAHSEYLQAFADAGFPGALAALAAAALLIRGAARRALAAPEADRAEAIVILALLATGAASALTWFPLQRPISAVPLLLVVGRAWKLSSSELRAQSLESKPNNPKHQTPNSRLLALFGRLALLVVLAAALWPEIPRYASERRLRAAQAALRFVLARTSEVADPPAALSRVADLALETSAALPGDPRPFVLAGAARRAAGQGDRALELFRSALATGERAEIDLNIGRTLEILGRMDESRAWFVRGGWVSPPLLGDIDARHRWPDPRRDLSPPSRPRSPDASKHLPRCPLAIETPGHRAHLPPSGRGAGAPRLWTGAAPAKGPRPSAWLTAPREAPAARGLSSHSLGSLLAPRAIGTRWLRSHLRRQTVSPGTAPASRRAGGGPRGNISWALL